MPDYTFFDHTADIGVEIIGRTKKQIFINAALTLADILIEKREGIPIEKSGLQKRMLRIEGNDIEDLLINYLRELLYWFNGEGRIVNSCEIRDCGPGKLTALLTVEAYHPRRHAIRTEIKAITYSGVSVVKEKHRWKAKVIFDV